MAEWSNLTPLRGTTVPTADGGPNDEWGEFGSRHASPTQTHIPKRKRKPHRKPGRTTASLTIGSLNINGGGSSNTAHKWENINQIIRDEKINVLVLQETHLTQERVEELHLRYKRLHIINTIDKEQTNAKGVAFVLDKHNTRWRESSTKELIEGRAISLALPWKSDKKMNILAIYAPNESEKQVNFWNDLKTIYENPQNPLPKPNIMLGDFNVVESNIDRNPPRNDNLPAVLSLQEFRNQFDLHDTWRNENPNTLSYTYTQYQRTTRKSQSRIDRIYIEGDLEDLCYDWKCRHSGIPSDHKLITTKIENHSLPFIGKGRWAMPLHILDNGEIINEIKQLGTEKLEALKRTRDPTTNEITPSPQALHKALKQEIQDLIREKMKTAIPKLENLIKQKKSTLKETLGELKNIRNNLQIEDEDNKDELTIKEREIHKTISGLETDLMHLHTNRHNTKRVGIRARFWKESETMSKAWINLNKERKPKDPIYRLKIPNSQPTEYTAKSNEMTEIAAKYHRDIQIDPDDSENTNRTEKINETLGITKRQLNQEDKNKMAQEISEYEIKKALNDLPNGKSPGLDGIPTELYKKLLDDYRNETRPAINNETPATIKMAKFNILEYLQIIYQDFAQNGPEEKSSFADGWLCPLYKKSEKEDIANYRPITVLNADYKILTRALTTRLGTVAHTIIHSDQAGFMKGRRITDHTDLIQNLTHLCELTDQNGAIICLDQEKAYDRIKHDYLWTTLDKFNFPRSFTTLVQNLYKEAYTTVIINGVKSTPFQIKRGVRQGDPLSCLLFNIAIEPLAEHIRESKLEGIKIDNEGEVKVSLFADDTTVYLSENNDLNDLFDILNSWCSASGAKFNQTKTEIIPLGKRTYRDKLRTNRNLEISAQKVNENIRIAEEGQPVRVLGVWIGHNVDHQAMWNTKIDKITHALTNWERSYPTQDGRKLILGLIAPGLTQYATRGQGMPDEIEGRLQKIITGFMWGAQQNTKITPPIRSSILNEPIDLGGKKVIDIQIRNEAIDLSKLRTYLTVTNPRPQWARITDRILNLNATNKKGIDDEKTRRNIFEQSWTVNTKKNSPLPSQIRKMINTAKKYNLRLDPPLVAKEMKEKMIIWHHTGLKKNTRLPHMKGKIAECMRKTHLAYTVGEALLLANTEWHETHTDLTRCTCPSCAQIKTTGCKHPNDCVKLANQWINSLNTKWSPRATSHEDDDRQLNIEERSPTKTDTTTRNTNGKTILNQNISARTPETEYRIFCDPNSTVRGTPATKEATLNPTDGSNEIEIEIATRNTNIKQQTAETRVAIHYKKGEHPDKIILIKHERASTEMGELIALQLIVRNVNTEDLVIHTRTTGLINLINNINKLEDRNLTHTNDPTLIRNTIAHLRGLPGKITLIKSKCKKAKEKLKDLNATVHTITDTSTLTPPNPNYKIEGARLQNMTQADLYKGIQAFRRRQTQIKYDHTHTRTPPNDRKHNDPRNVDADGNSTRHATMRQLDIARHSIHDRYNILPTDKDIWNTLRRNKDISKKIKAFLWTALHEGQKIGKYWEKMNNLEHRGKCRNCETTETLEHILTECTASGQETAWELAEEIIRNQDKEWNRPKLGEITSQGYQKEKKNRGNLNRPRKETNRLKTIIITETAHLIWKMRCKWRINDNEDLQKVPTQNEIKIRWTNAINIRLKTDCLLTSKKKYKRNAIPRAQVQETWKGTIEDEFQLPENWVNPGVLVGIKQIMLEPHTTCVNAFPPVAPPRTQADG